MEEPMFYTYLWLREDGTPYYVGKGSGNRAYSKHKRHGNAPSLDRIVLYITKDEQDAFDTEISLIWYYGRKDLGLGCLRNLTDGGENPPKGVRKGSKMPEWLKEKLIILSIGRVPWNKGLKGTCKHTEEGRAIISKTHKGRVPTPAMLSALAKRNQGNKNTLGRKHSEESKALMRLHHNPNSSIRRKKPS
jgi:hypothetical protein